MTKETGVDAQAEYKAQLKSWMRANYVSVKTIAELVGLNLGTVRNWFYAKKPIIVEHQRVIDAFVKSFDLFRDARFEGYLLARAIVSGMNADGDGDMVAVVVNSDENPTDVVVVRGAVSDVICELAFRHALDRGLDVAPRHVWVGACGKNTVRNMTRIMADYAAFREDIEEVIRQHSEGGEA